MGTRVEHAAELFSKGFSCSQAVFASHCEDFGMDAKTALRAAGAFGGGMGHSGEACGAVTGALMLLGMKYGKVDEADLEAKESTYEKVKEFVRLFKARHGSIRCNELVGYELGVDKELADARAAGVFKTLCPLLVRDSIELVETLL
jgi:C_GCAxxG_C_C family probable redox protein